jgi:hypothetical protein
VQPEPVPDAAPGVTTTKGRDEGDLEEGRRETVTGSADAALQLVVREEVLSLRGEELGRLLEALARLDLRDAEAVADDIAALRLAGGVIRLTPTEAELAALERALAALAAEARPLGPALRRLASVCADDSPLPEQRPA